MNLCRGLLSDNFTKQKAQQGIEKQPLQLFGSLGSKKAPASQCIAVLDCFGSFGLVSILQLVQPKLHQSADRRESEGNLGICGM